MPSGHGRGGYGRAGGLIQAALNGGRDRSEHRGIPFSAAELAEAARGAVAAGAAALHVHPRDESGRESLSPEVIGQALTAIREAVPGVPVGVSTGRWITPGGRERHREIAAWEVLPDYVSLNLSEEDAPEVAEIARARGLGLEAGVWNVADVERLLGMPWRDDVLRVLIEITEQDPAGAIAMFDAVVERLDADGIVAPRLSHGLNAGFWPLVPHIAAAGHGLRVGLEDVLVLPDGRPAPDNAALVRAVRR